MEIPEQSIQLHRAVQMIMCPECDSTGLYWLLHLHT